MSNIINIRKRKTQSNLSGSTGSILVHPNGDVASTASVIAIVALCANRVSVRYRIRSGDYEKRRGKTSAF